jgi:SnoaL-like domain
MQELKRAIEAHDEAAVERLLAPAVVFRSPALHKPYAGRAVTMVFLRAAMQVLEDFRYVHTYTEDAADEGGQGHVLMFEANVGGRALEGADFITVGIDGLVTEFRVMVRPMTGLMALAEAMAPRVEAPLAALLRDVSEG